jgi:hypothetical protein
MMASIMNNHWMGAVNFQLYQRKATDLPSNLIIPRGPKDVNRLQTEENQKTWSLFVPSVLNVVSKFGGQTGPL